MDRVWDFVIGEVYRVFSIYEGIQYLVSVGGQTIPGQAAQGETFGVVWVTSDEGELLFGVGQFNVDLCQTELRCF